MRAHSVVWISSGVRDALLEEAHAKYPLETGGVLLGYWTNAAHEAVISNLVGPGPDASHDRHHFKPDYEFQQLEIDRIYAESAGQETYLGDWHTHPAASAGRLSATDKATIRSIATCPEARAPTPLMMILSGGPDEWRAQAWLGRLNRPLGFQSLGVREVIFRPF